MNRVCVCVPSLFSHSSAERGENLCAHILNRIYDITTNLELWYLNVPPHCGYQSCVTWKLEASSAQTLRKLVTGDFMCSVVKL